ncbi:AT-rich interactive domain-containing protein 4B-like isoform X2 [Centruroides vittatus]
MHVEAKHPEKNQYAPAIIAKIFDYSQYTVVFDDGDETTLRRTSLCLKSGRHFAESETLDQLPLTNPEHFGIPVIGSKNKRKRRSIASCSSMDGDSSSEELHSKRKKDTKKDYESDIAKVVCVDMGDKRKKDNWFPALIVSPTSQDIKINSKDYYLVRSFKDGKYYQVKKKETKMFTKEIGSKVENNLLKTAVEKANLYLSKDEIPPHWDWDLMMGRDDEDNDDQNSDIETSDDEPSEEKDRFVAQLYKFMDERGTPINRAPTVSGRDLNLYKLFNIVQQMGGYNRVTNQNKWRTIYTKMGLVMTNPACSIQIKKAYKRYLHSFEDFNRKLGCTMVSNTRSGHTRYRSDRNIIMTRKREQNLPLIRSRLSRGAKIKSKQKSDESAERRSRPSKSDDGESARQKEESKSPNNAEPKREKIETRGSLKNEQEKIKCNLIKDKKKEKSVNSKTKEEKNNKEKPKVTTKEVAKDKSVPVKVKVEEDKEPLKKKNGKSEDKDSGEKVATNDSEMKPKRNEAIVRIGDRIRVKYGNGKQHKKYEAKVLKIERESGERKFFVHYTGWNVRYDEWIKKNKIVEVIENKSGNDRKKKGVLWPGSKSKELVKRSKLFKLSLRKSKASSLATSKISKSASVICRTRRQDSTSDSSSNGGSQTRKSRRKPPNSDNEADTSHNTNDAELGQESQSQSDPNTSDETIKVEFLSDAEESNEEKNREETEKEEECSWEDGDAPDDKELPKLEEETVEDTKIGVFANLSPVLPPKEGPNSAECRMDDSVDLPNPGFDITSDGFIPCQNIKVEKDWELETPEECEKIPEAALSKDSEGLEMPDISTDQNAIGPKPEMAAAKTEEEEKTETELEEAPEPVNLDDLHPPEIAWKMESLPDSASLSNDDHPPPLEKKPDFSPDAGEERYETRPLLERAVSETEELSCKIPNITLRDYLGGENSADEEGSAGKSSSESNPRSEPTNGDGLEVEDNTRRSCHPKTEEWTRPRGEAATAKKDKKKKRKLFKADGGDINANLSGKSDAEKPGSERRRIKEEGQEGEEEKGQETGREQSRNGKRIVGRIQFLQERTEEGGRAGDFRFRLSRREERGMQEDEEEQKEE